MKEVKKQIEERSEAANLPIFREMIAQVHGMFTHDHNNISPEALLKNCERVTEKYAVRVGVDRSVACLLVEEERTLRKRQVTKASHQTKKFSEAALAFSEELARTI